MRLLVGFGIAAAATVASPANAAAAGTETDATVAACLASPLSPCDPRRRCRAVDVTRECLRSRVPWRTPFARVHCCHRCCLRYWSRRLTPGATWKALKHYKDTAPLADHSVLLGHATAFEFASARAVHAARRFGSPDGPADLREHIEWAAAAPPTFAAVDGQRLALAYAETSCAPPPTLLITSDNPWPDLLPTKARPGTPAATMKALAARGVRRFYVSNVLRRVVAGGPLDVRLYPRAALRVPGGWREALNGSEARPWRARRELLLCECVGYLERGKRVEALAALAGNGFARCARRGRCPPPDGLLGPRFKHLGWADAGTLADRVADAKFGLSPPGRGEACHREWEYLLLGAAPVVRRLGTPRGAALQAELYRDLPVLVVDDFRQLTPATLAAEAARFAARENSFDLAKAYWPYWLAELTEEAWARDAAAFAARRVRGGGGIVNASSC